MYLGKKIPIPRKQNAKSWKKLQNQITEFLIEDEKRIYLKRLMIRHSLEKKISELISRKNPYPGIERDINRLRKELAAV